MTDLGTIRALRAAASDLNGVARGKRLPVGMAEKIAGGAVRFPLSVLNLDICGDDIEGSPLVLDSGDRDGVLHPTGRGFVPMPWLDTPTALAPVWMFHEDGSAYAGDPRHALAGVLDRFAARGLTPVVATEMEFFLVDDADGLQVPASPRSGKRRPGGQILSLGQLDAFDAFFTDLYDGCAAMDIPAGTAISESGYGQFEITMEHQPDAMKAADDAWLFKLLTKGLARKHGFAASFMAKPYADCAGSGMHMHFSVLDEDGRNVFDDGGSAGTDMLRHAVEGCLAALPACTVLFAPHGVSYDRLVPGAHAPTSIAWAYENRTAAIRIPSGAPAARRVEHRFSGADVSPHLAIAAILGGAIGGIEDGRDPVAPITGNAYEQDLPRVPATWQAALSAFETSDVAARIFPDRLRANFAMTKRQEMAVCAGLSAEALTELYLDTV
ncbi:MAG: glutamine synthetase family protein [Pseudomonadota bacterium]